MTKEIVVNGIFVVGSDLIPNYSIVPRFKWFPFFFKKRVEGGRAYLSGDTCYISKEVFEDMKRQNLGGSQ